MPLSASALELERLFDSLAPRSVLVRFSATSPLTPGCQWSVSCASTKAQITAKKRLTKTKPARLAALSRFLLVMLSPPYTPPSRAVNSAGEVSMRQAPSR